MKPNTGKDLNYTKKSNDQVKNESDDKTDNELEY